MIRVPFFFTLLYRYVSFLIHKLNFRIIITKSLPVLRHYIAADFLLKSSK
jgi:hypothetical protein